MAGKTSFADLRALCEKNGCEPALRTETRSGRVYVSLAAIQKSAPNKTMYDIRGDQAWDDFPLAAAMLDQALGTWWA